MREVKVRHPDGRIWFVQHRWVRRRPFWRERRAWSERAANPDSPYGERELKAKAGADAAFDGFLSSSGVWLLDIASDAGVLGVVVVLVVALLALLGSVLFLARVVIEGAQRAPEWIAANPAPAVAVLAGLVGVAALLLIRRPWLVVAQRLGAGDDVPRRAWLVTGWRRSRAFARELAAAIQRGGVSRDAVVLFTRGPRS